MISGAYRLAGGVAGMAGTATMAAFVLAGGPAAAGPVADYFNSIDFNDYALSLNYYVSEPRYTGVDPRGVLYPMLSSYEHATLTDDPLFVRDANLGLRKTGPGGFTYGIFGRFYTDGYPAGASAALAGMDPRAWSVAGGVLLGHKLGPLRADLFASTELFDRHGGGALNLKLAWPIAWSGTQFIPQLEATRFSASYMDYYFGVSSDEATPTRPAFVPGAGTVMTASFDLNRRLSPNWYLRLSLGYDLLPDEIRSSPIVDQDSTWRVGLGVAYDTGNFVRLNSDAAAPSGWHVDASVETFFLRSKTVVTLADNAAGESLKLENEGLESRDTAVPVEIVLRTGRFHSFTLRYFELSRDGSVALENDRQVGGETFSAGETLATDLSTRVARLAYGFSFFRDAQKELAVLGGVHATRFEYAVTGENGAAVRAATNAVLPMFGARLRASFTERIALHVGVELFLMDFDRFSGSLVDLAAEMRYRLGETWQVGAGYRGYRQSLEAGEQQLRGDLELDYRGPYLSLSAAFH